MASEGQGLKVNSLPSSKSTYTVTCNTKVGNYFSLYLRLINIDSFLSIPLNFGVQKMLPSVNSRKLEIHQLPM